MSDLMTFPNTVEEFMEQYKIIDTEQVYTNGTELVPIFRMEQWFEHLPRKGKWVIDNGLYRCSACNHLWSELWWVETVPLEKMLELMPYCPKCGVKMENAAGVPDSSIGSC